MSQKYELYSVMPYENPSIAEYVKKSNGKFLIGSPFDKEIVKKYHNQGKEEEKFLFCWR